MAKKWGRTWLNNKVTWPLPCRGHKCPRAVQKGCSSLPTRLRLQDEDPWIELQSEDLALALWHPCCVGAKGKQHQETGKRSHFLPEQTRTDHSHGCFLLRTTKRTKLRVRLLSLCAGDSHWGESILVSGMLSASGFLRFPW